MLTDLLAEHRTGVLITLDEIHHNQIVELRELATTIQDAFREDRDVAFAGAGLAASVTDVVNDDVLTFLRRAERHPLGPVPRADVRRAFREPIEAAGRSVGDAALHIMVDGADGYPFLLQLVGAHTWRQHPDRREITVDDATAGVAAARRRLAALIHEPALHGLSDMDRAFLHAMAHDSGGVCWGPPGGMGPGPPIRSGAQPGCAVTCRDATRSRLRRALRPRRGRPDG